MKNALQDLKRALMTGVSYMLPFIVGAGMLIALGTVLSQFGLDTGPMLDLGYGLFGFIPHIVGAYVAFGIADRPGIAPGFAGGYVAAQIGAGFLGGILAGFIAGYLVNLLKKIPVHEYIYALKPMLLIPLLGIAFTALAMSILGQPIAWLQTTLDAWLTGVSGSSAVLLGAVIGAMMAFDMGGPLGKIALTFVVGAYSQGIYGPNAAAFPGIMTAPVSVALAAMLFPKKFNTVERKNAPATLVTGLFGISEGAIPYAMANPLRTIPAFMAGAAVGGGMMMALDLETKMFSGLVALPFTDRWLLFSLSILVGVAVSIALLYLLKKEPTPEEEDEISDILDIME